MRSIPRIPLLFLPVFLLAPEARSAEVVMVSSVLFNGYKREHLPDNSLKPEFYVFGEGGRWRGGAMDPRVEQLKFLDVAQAVAVPLAHEGYRPALSSDQADLLILVFWGTTLGSRGSDHNLAMDRAAAALADFNRTKPSDQAVRVDPNSPEGAAMDAALWELSVANGYRDDIDDRNARVLGFGEALSRARFAPNHSFAQDTLAAISDNRYYVVLQAYDFASARKLRKLKPLWTVRMSVSDEGDFKEALNRMVWSGARFFGQESDGLRRTRPGDPTVELGPLKILETVPSPAK